jgi:hypothetical protein
MATYVIDSEGIIIRDDGVNIPVAPDNRDYQAYLAWVALGNVAPHLPPPEPSQEDVNRALLFDAASAAIEINNNMATQIAGIISYANAIANSAQADADTATLLAVIKALSGGIQTLAEHDAESLSQRNGIIRLVIGQLDATD